MLIQVCDTGADDRVLPCEVADQIGPVWHDGLGILTDYAGKPRTARHGSVWFQIRLGDRLVRWAAIVAFDHQRADEVRGEARSPTKWLRRAQPFSVKRNSSPSGSMIPASVSSR
jgi:hypothetical protein